MPTPDRRGGRSNICCPKCQMLGTTRRSRTRWWERPIGLVSPRKPYRCRRCHLRFWLGPWRERRTDRHPGRSWAGSPRLKNLAPQIALMSRHNMLEAAREGMGGAMLPDLDQLWSL